MQVVELIQNTERKKGTYVCAIPGPAGAGGSWPRCLLMVTPASLTATSLAKCCNCCQHFGLPWPTSTLVYLLCPSSASMSSFGYSSTERCTFFPGFFCVFYQETLQPASFCKIQFLKAEKDVHIII